MGSEVFSFPGGSFVVTLFNYGGGDCWITYGLVFIVVPFCPQKCPFEAIQIINLPKDLDKDTTHRYGPNTFKLHRCVNLLICSIRRQSKLFFVLWNFSPLELMNWIERKE